MGDLHPWCARVTVCLLPGRDAGHRARPVLPSLPSSTRHLHRVWRPSLSHLRRPHAALPGNVHVRPGAGLPGRRLQVGPCLSWLAPGKQEKYPFYIKDWLTPHFVCTAFTWLTTTAAVKEFPGPRRWLCLSGMSPCSSSRTGLWRFVLRWVSFKMFWMPCTRCRFQNDTFFDTKCFRTSLNNNNKIQTSYLSFYLWFNPEFPPHWFCCVPVLCRYILGTNVALCFISPQWCGATLYASLAWCQQRLASVFSSQLYNVKANRQQL